jgi:asparagine N-glycosylation enzyme membrane subunit Stt3
MSDIASTRGTTSDTWSLAAVLLAAASVATWALAGFVDDGLYLLTGALGAIAVGAGVKAYRDAKTERRRTWPALAAMVVGGALAGLVLAFAIVYVLS